MALRSRLRRAFTRSSDDEPTALSKASSKQKSKDSKKDSNVYGPDEKMPPLKYRRPVAPEHKAHLESFSWANAWRRKSVHSVYSPMGSRMPSQRNSFQSLGRRSIIRASKSFTRADDGSAVDSGIGASLAGDDQPEQLPEGSDEEGDVTNGTLYRFDSITSTCVNSTVGLSRPPTNDPSHPRPSSTGRCRSHSTNSGPESLATTDYSNCSLSTTKTDTLFTPEDLAFALKRSNLESTKEESDCSGQATPGSPGGRLLKIFAGDQHQSSVIQIERLETERD
jgi:hypothetical protein